MAEVADCEAQLLGHQVLALVEERLDLVLPKVAEYTRRLVLSSVKQSFGEALPTKRLAAKDAHPRDGASVRETMLLAGSREKECLSRESQQSPSLSRESPRESERLLPRKALDRDPIEGKRGPQPKAPVKSSTIDDVTLASRSVLLDETAMQVNQVDHVFEALRQAGCLRHLMIPCYRCAQWLQELQEPPSSGCLHDFLYSQTFRAVSGAVILINAIQAATSANFEVIHGEGAETELNHRFEVFFLLWYSMEVALALCLHGCYFFVNENWVWNNLDIVIILQSIFERVMLSMFKIQSHGGQLTYMRSFRILRVVKALRAMKFIKFFKQLRLMLNSITNSFASLFGMILMLVFILYMSTLVFMQGVIDYLSRPGADPLYAEAMHKYFGTMTTGMISMYMSCTGGADWEVLYRLMEQVGPIYVWCFLFFTLFTNVVVFNILAAMMVENVLKLAEPDRDQQAHEWACNRMASHEEILNMCMAMDRDASGSVSWAEFEDYVADPRAASHFASLELDVNHAEMFFKTLCCLTGREEVQIDAFVEGCTRMKGPASSIDLHILSVQVKMLERHLLQLHAAPLREGSEASHAATPAREAMPLPPWGTS